MCVGEEAARQLGVLQLAVLPFSMRQGRGQAVLYGSLQGSACINDENLAVSLALNAHVIMAGTRRIQNGPRLELFKSR